MRCLEEIQPETFQFNARAGASELFEMEQFEYSERELNRNTPDYVRWVQVSLNKVMGLRLAVDGKLGPATRGAIRSFQARRGLPVDGIVGPKSAQALVAAGAEPLQLRIPTLVLPGRAPSSPLAGGRPAGVPAEPPCTTLDRFSRGTETILPAHQPKLIAVARRILAEGISAADVTGFASSEGSDLDNFALGQRRAERVARELRTTLDRIRPGSSRTVALNAISRGESEQIARGNFELNRRVTICLRMPRPSPTPVIPIQTKVFRVTGKSFIAHIGSNVGRLDCGIDTPFGRVPGASNIALRVFAAATDRSFSENPTNDRTFTAPPPASKGYRLFSQGNIQVAHRGSDIFSVVLRGSITTDSGKECEPSTGACLQAPPLTIDQPFNTVKISPTAMQFCWGVKGRPPTITEPAFQAICKRDCVFIWHQIKGITDSSRVVDSPAIVCGLTELNGSQFPKALYQTYGTATPMIEVAYDKACRASVSSLNDMGAVRGEL